MDRVRREDAQNNVHGEISTGSVRTDFENGKAAMTVGAFDRTLTGLTRAMAVAMMLFVSACAGTPAEEQEAQQPGAVEDPFEDVNRVIFDINLFLDDFLIRPVADGYRYVLAPGARDVVRDFIRNLTTPVQLVNNILQGDWDQALVTTQRFFINTASTGGLVDVAALEGYPFRNEDFGQTMGVGGVVEGPYLVLPIIGPSNTRDTVGMVVDILIDPITWATSSITAGYIGASGGLDARARNVEALDELREDSVDYYARLRSLYTQKRRSEIVNGEADQGSFPTPGLDSQ
ncbi:VacJ family lipoprotein [Limibacillus sp. MBR-115]|jgi:phospholipid-binding lipoprotein MlaA|uniref:MlaA family lipoprotein n=1 Tax=Limibacillus sp. MBR-115 TaxID=3156465 RepID=UPI00339432B4